MNRELDGVSTCIRSWHWDTTWNFHIEMLRKWSPAQPKLDQFLQLLWCTCQNMWKCSCFSSEILISKSFQRIQNAYHVQCTGARSLSLCRSLQAGSPCPHHCQVLAKLFCPGSSTTNIFKSSENKTVKLTVKLTVPNILCNIVWTNVKLCRDAPPCYWWCTFRRF